MNELIRREKLALRRGISEDKRQALSAEICARLEALPEYQYARTIMVYKSTRGEVDLSYLSGKRFAYPLCIGSDMVALVPEGRDSFKLGSYGIEEPIRELSRELMPEDIDLVICPCSAFDSQCNRLGMGKGFYDRFLPKCVRARFIAVAFELQRAEGIAPEPWDVAMDMVVTEMDVIKRDVPFSGVL